MTDDEVVTLVGNGINILGGTLGGPIGLALGVIGQLVEPVYKTIAGGGQPDAVIANIKEALVKASDADMKAELGP